MQHQQPPIYSVSLYSLSNSYSSANYLHIPMARDPVSQLSLRAATALLDIILLVVLHADDTYMYIVHSGLFCMSHIL